jgi:beta-glucanase (GH16 family)
MAGRLAPRLELATGMSKSDLAVSTLVAATSLLTACGGGNTPPSAATYTIGGTVSGLSGAGLVLQNNDGNNLAVDANGAFTFSSSVASGGTYDVTIFLQPSSPAQTCAVTNSSGIANADVTSVQVACTGTPDCSGVPNLTIGSVTWLPQWCQEFNGPANLPDTTVWSFDLGNNYGWGNNEVEVYCGPPGYPDNPPQCPSSFSTTTDTVYIDGNGHLVIQPINADGTWLSTRMKTEGLENFKYGLIEASLRIPNTTNQGLWPAFWSLGSDYPGTPWPMCGEADFMENWSPQVDGGPGPTGNRSTIHTAETGGTGIGGAYTFPSGQQADTAFHIYGVIWSPDMMEFYVDDPSAPFFVVTPDDLPPGDTWPFNADIFLIVNVAVGGTLGGSTTGLNNPQPLVADYVRWYTPSSGPAAAKPAVGNPIPSP